MSYTLDSPAVKSFTGEDPFPTFGHEKKAVSFSFYERIHSLRSDMKKNAVFSF